MSRFKVFFNAKEHIIVEAQTVKHVHNKIDFIPIAVVKIDEKNRIAPQPGFYYPGEEPSGGGWQ